MSTIKFNLVKFRSSASMQTLCSVSTCSAIQLLDDTHGRRSRGGGQGGQVPPRIWSGGTLIQIVPPPQISSYRYKKERSVAFKIHQNCVFGRDSAPDPAGGAHDAPSDPLVGWRGDTLPHMPPHSTQTHLRRSPCIPPEVQPDLRLCG